MVPGGSALPPEITSANHKGSCSNRNAQILREAAVTGKETFLCAAQNRVIAAPRAIRRPGQAFFESRWRCRVNTHDAAAAASPARSSGLPYEGDDPMDSGSLALLDQRPPELKRLGSRTFPRETPGTFSTEILRTRPGSSMVLALVRRSSVYQPVLRCPASSTLSFGLWNKAHISRRFRWRVESYVRSLSALWPSVFAGEQDVGPPKR